MVPPETFIKAPPRCKQALTPEVGLFETPPCSKEPPPPPPPQLISASDNAPAVAAASEAASSTATQQPTQMDPLDGYNKEFFDAFPYFRGKRQQHNEAAKFFRWQAGTDHAYEYRCEAETEVYAVKHDKTGAGFTIDQSTKKKWSWLEMVAQMNPQSRNSLLNGSTLQECTFKIRPGQEERWYATKEFVWDFIIKRSDGTAVAVHPEYSTTNISMSALGQRDQAPEDEERGKHTYKYKHYRNVLQGQEKLKLKFDPARTPHHNWCAQRNAQPQSRKMDPIIAAVTACDSHFFVRTTERTGSHRVRPMTIFLINISWWYQKKKTTS